MSISMRYKRFFLFLFLCISTIIILPNSFLKADMILENQTFSGVEEINSLYGIIAKNITLTETSDLIMTASSHVSFKPLLTVKKGAKFKVIIKNNPVPMCQMDHITSF